MVKGLAGRIVPHPKKSPSPTERWSLPVQQDRSRATRERLLEAAEIVFAKKGYDGARLADIAQEAGCSVGTVYFRFKDKSALFSAIAESFIEEARQGFAMLLKQAPAEPEQIIRQFVTASAANFQRHRGLFRAIVERGIEHPQAMRSIFKFRDELAASLEETLHGSGKRSSDISVRVMTQMVYGFLLAGILNEHAPTRIDDVHAVGGLADACVAYLTHGKGKS